MPVHHCQAVAKHMNPREPTGFQNRCSAFGFEERQAQQHADAWCQIERMRDKRVCQFVRRVCDDRLDAVGRLTFHQEVNAAAAVGTAPVVKISGDDVVSGAA